MKERSSLERESSESHGEIDFRNFDTFVFDYGGVVALHYCEPWQGNLGKLLQCEPKRVKELLSESSEQGKDYRLGKKSRQEFWTEVMRLANVSGVDMGELEENWARSYQIDPRMLDVIHKLRKAGKRVGILMNSDKFRHGHIEKEYKLSGLVDFVVASCHHGVVKPEKSAYEHALHIADRTHAPERVVYIDDRERNIVPCLELGMKGIVFSEFEPFYRALIEQKVISL